ncbi:HDOD domain-containing protein [candidate division KSB1 bacterium]|nr:HDOD domain-containing protein [candidate division KSB1 bacterium]
MEVFLARQPIFDRQQKVYAYELLYRSGCKNNFYDDSDGDQATSTVLTHSFLSIGIDTLTRGKMAFVNFSRNLLVQEFATVFPNKSIGVEILEDVAPDAEIVTTCEKLKRLGYTLVLDDFVFKPELSPLLELVDIIKVDFVNTEVEQRSSIIQRVDSRRIKFLAKKVETHEDFKQAVEMGYSYFQGYFFAEPDMIAGRDVPAYKLNFLRLLQQVNQPNLDYDQLENIFKEEVTLSYKLFRYINSAYFGFPNEIRSIRHALSLIGLCEAKKWLSLIAMSSMGKDKSEELVLSSLFRANLCESLASLVGLEEQASELFLVGLFSRLDAFLDQPLSDILSKLPVSEDMKNALLGKKGTWGQVFQLAVSYERGDWDQVFLCLSNLKSAEKDLTSLFIETVIRTDRIYLSVN